MKALPKSDKTLLVRTDFSDAAAWRDICAKSRAPGPELQEALGLFASVNEAIGQSLGEVGTSLHIVDDPQYKDLNADQLLRLLPKRSKCVLLLVADSVTISNPAHPVLVIDAAVEPGRTFRSIPSQVFAIESNLSIGNMDWEDFSSSVDAQGVFRGFAK
jgi:hypothetical protein